MPGPHAWSFDPSSNDVIDPSIFLVEGQPPNTLNDAVRGVMAGVKRLTLDLWGANHASGTASGTISVQSNQGFVDADLAEPFDFALTVDATNVGPVFLSIDGTASKKIIRPDGAVLGPRDLRSGPRNRVARAPNFNDSYVLVEPSPISAGSFREIASETAVPPGWVLCDGRALSRSAYSALFAAIGTTFGAGNGTTTFNVPDFRGRASFGADALGGTAAGRLTGAGGLGGAVGAAGGSEAVALSVAQMPAFTPTGTVSPGGARDATTTSDSGAHDHGSNTADGGAHTPVVTADPVPNHSHSGTATAQDGHAHTYKTAALKNGVAQSGTGNGPFWAGGDVDAATTTTNPTLTVTTAPSGAHTPVVTAAPVPAHKHSITAALAHSHVVPAVAAHGHDLAMNSIGAGAAHPNVSPGLVVLRAIKA